MAALMLFFSCQQYDNPIPIDSQNFDYSLFDEFKSANIQLVLTNINRTSINKFEALVDLVNLNLNTDLDFPESASNLINSDSEKIFEQALNNGWVSQSEVNLTKTFISEIHRDGFDKAIANYEEVILNRKLSDQEFSKQNKIVNILKSQNYANPNLFNPDLSDRNSLSDDEECGWCKCAAAIVGLTAATAGLSGCATIAACALATALFYAAVNGVTTACSKDKDADAKTNRIIKS